MKKLLLIISLTTCVAAKAQLPSGVDSTFGTYGTAHYSLSAKNNKVGAIRVVNDKIFMVGTQDGAKDDLFVMKTDKDGKPDSSFNGTGVLVYDPKVGADDQGYGLDIQPDGKILICGRTEGNTDHTAFVARLNPDGSLDMTFNVKGWKEIAIGPGDNIAYGIKYHKNKIYVACASSSVSKFIYIVRLDMSGDYDATYGLLNGFSVLDVDGNNNESFRDFKFTTNDDMLIMGATYDGSNTYQFVYKVDSNAKNKVTSFGTNGIYQYNTNKISRFNKMKIANDGSIYIAGYEYTTSGYAGLLVKLNPNGGLDNSFASGNGKSLFKVSTQDDNCRFHDLTILSDTNIMIVGLYADKTDDHSLAVLYKSNGQVNTSFNKTGSYYESPYPGNMYPKYQYIDKLSDGKVIVSGNITDTVQGNDVATLTRFKNVETDTTTSISDVKSGQILSIYPNPTSGEVTIKSEKKIERVQLLNVTGAHMKFLDPVINNTYRIDTNLPTGMYYLRIHTNSAVITERIILTN